MKRVELELPDQVAGWLEWVSEIRGQPIGQIVAQFLVPQMRMYESTMMDAEEVTGSRIVIGETKR